MKQTVKRIKNGLPVVDNQLKNYQKVIETKKQKKNYKQFAGC